ncbi:MAG: TIGR00341 family protein [Hyphomonadaceae bacterium]|nr:TIGR00341 family protein [Hyphomonadaceae bacterium]
MRRLDLHMRDGALFETALKAIRAADPIDYIVVPMEQKDRRYISVFLRDGTRQTLVDNLQSCLENEKDWRISIVSIEATVPSIAEDEELLSRRASQRKMALREEIYQDVAADAKLDRDFIIFVILSTIVAAIGLHSNSVAGVIGAMVIAPLLGPILGFSLGAALGDRDLIYGALKTLGVGVLAALACSVLISFMINVDFTSRELISRAEVRLDGMALAIAAGAAAALSLTRGANSTLVGVMVAAALLPPGAAVGLFLGSGEWALASRAALLLSLNVASLVLSALVVFRLRDIRPRRWLEKKDADRAVAINIVLSALLLVIAIVLISVLDLGATVSLG